MSGAPTCSVVIATYGRGPSLVATLESLLGQTHPVDEIVVAAAAEDTATIATVESLIEASPGAAIRLVTSARGVGPQENAGIAAARGEVIGFTDDDVLVPPQWLARLLAHYRDPAVGGVGGRDVIHGQGGVDVRPVTRVGYVHWFGRLVANHHKLVRGVRQVDFLKGCNMSFRRRLAPAIDRRLVGRIPYGFEVDMGLDVRDRGARLIYDPELTVDHYPSSDMSAGDSGRARTVNHNHTYILLKHLSWPRRLAFLLYTLAIGDRDTVGLVRGLFLALRGGWPPGLVAAHLAGKADGIGCFLSWCWEERRLRRRAGEREVAST